jgi:hypothetical protein
MVKFSTSDRGPRISKKWEGQSELMNDEETKIGTKNRGAFELIPTYIN